MRKVWLDNLPRIKGYSGSRIDWMKSTDYKIKFEYDDIVGEFEILHYNEITFDLMLKYNNKKCLPIKRCDLRNGKLARVLGMIIKDHKYQNLEVLRNCIKIIDTIYLEGSYKNRKYKAKGYKYECLECGYTGEVSESNIRKTGCPVCSGHKVENGFNDLWTTHPNIATLLLNHDEGYIYSYGSSVKVDWKCPDCGEVIKNKVINNIVGRKKLACICSDGISYPEKLMYQVLLQLNIDFIYQYSPNWIKPLRYDFYFEVGNKKYIIETDGGLGHGNYNKLTGTTAQESLEVDIYKDAKAKEYDIDVVRIDCQKSDLDYIKNNLLSSKLNSICDCSSINWLKCHELSCKSFIKIASELWNKGYINKEISEELKLSDATIRTYLKQGARIGWCNYSSTDYHNLKVICVNTKIIFNSTGEATREFNIHKGGITACCRGTQKSAGKHPETGEKLKWMYLEDYNKMIENSNEPPIRPNS